MTSRPRLPAPDPQQLRDAVVSWLFAIPWHDSPPTDERKPPPTLKRRRSRSHCSTGFRSPPLTAESTMQSPDDDNGNHTPQRNKRRRGTRDDGDYDVDVTPRPLAGTGTGLPASVRLEHPSLSESSSATSLTRSSQRSEASSPTRRSSPTKQMASLAMRPDGLETRPLRVEAEGLPPALVEMVRALKKVENGKRVISSDLAASIHDQVQHNRAFDDDFDESVFAPPADRDRLGPTPRVEDVWAIYNWATVTDRLRAGEDSWNVNVHGPLLRIALHGGNEPKDVLVDFQSCMSTPLITPYVPRQAHSKRVDFVMVLNPQHDETGQGAAAVQAIDEIRDSLPEKSINHCSHECLWQRPVAVSVETKKSGVSDREAELQVATWLAAQLRLLRKLVGGGGGGRSSTTTTMTGVLGADAEDVSDGRQRPGTTFSAAADPRTSDDLPFLPAIIVHGHDWKFAAATQDGQKTVLWRDQPFGSTRDVLGVFKIVAGIQHIARYVEETYWPWYKDAVLGLKPGA